MSKDGKKKDPKPPCVDGVCDPKRCHYSHECPRILEGELICVEDCAEIVAISVVAVGVRHD